jgi:hypothetical protein
MREKEDETAPEPADVKAKLVSLRWSSQVDAELASSSASPPCCLAVQVPPECLTTNVNTAIDGAHTTRLTPLLTTTKLEKDHIRAQRWTLKPEPSSRVPSSRETMPVPGM